MSMLNKVKLFLRGAVETLKQKEVRMPKRVLSLDPAVMSEELEGLGRIKFPVYVFGYGSLLFSNGWYRRGMQKEYGIQDLQECWLDGFKRGMYGRFIDQLYYGIIPNKKDRINGVIVKIDNEHDYVRLMYTERAKQIVATYALFDVAPINYEIEDVTHKIYEFRRGTELKLEPNSNIHAVVNKRVDPLRRIATPVWNYYAYVARNVHMQRSRLFVKEFFDTGGISNEDLDKLWKKSRKW